MKPLKFLSITALTCILFLSCKKEAATTVFVNKLTFGASQNYTNFTLNGEGTSFSTVPGIVTYRLESAEDFNGNPVKFVIKKDGVDYSNEVFASNPKPTGHIFMTGLSYNLKGSYSVTAYIQKSGGDATVASGTFQMKE